MQQKKRPRILLADDDLELIAATCTLLQADFDVVGKVSGGLSLVEAAFKLRPDVIVTDSHAQNEWTRSGSEDS